MHEQSSRISVCVLICIIYVSDSKLVNRLKMLVFVKFYRNRKLQIKFYIPHNKTIVPTNTQSFTEIRRFLATVLFTDIGETDRQTDRQ